MLTGDRDAHYLIQEIDGVPVRPFTVRAAWRGEIPRRRRQIAVSDAVTALLGVLADVQALGIQTVAGRARKAVDDALFDGRESAWIGRTALVVLVAFMAYVAWQMTR
jgi:hypothetical protein